MAISLALLAQALPGPSATPLPTLSPYTFAQQVLPSLGWRDTTWGAALFLIAIVVAGWLIKKWIDSAIDNRVGKQLIATKAKYDGELAEQKKRHDIDLAAVKLEMDRRLKDYEEEIKVRAKAEKIVDLLVHATSGNQDAKVFNQMAWALSLYLPANIICKMAQVLVAGNGTIFDVLIETRKYLLGNQNDPLIWQNIVSMPMGNKVPAQQPVQQQIAVAPVQPPAV